MASDNLQRMIELAGKVFDVKNDPDQLDISPEVREQLLKIHPATISQFTDDNGPVAWVIVIPTTKELMNRFLQCEISEKKLFEFTPVPAGYEAIYLCSALVLEEYRRKGIVKRLVLKAIEDISKNHPIKSLFVWPFSKEGNLTAKTIARLTGLPLYERREKEVH